MLPGLRAMAVVVVAACEGGCRCAACTGLPLPLALPGACSSSNCVALVLDPPAQGLRERNWTSKYYKPDAEKWSLQFFQARPASCHALPAAVCLKDLV